MPDAHTKAENAPPSRPNALPTACQVRPFAACLQVELEQENETTRFKPVPDMHRVKSRGTRDSTRETSFDTKAIEI
jgi:hypothetical protein